MNADQLAEIRPALREAIAGGPNCCVTLEVSGEPSQWIQFVSGTLNCAYPLDEPPALARLFPNWCASGQVALLDWQARKFVTFDTKQLNVDDLAKAIDSLFVGLLACTEGQYHLDVSFEDV